jgi:hypothetical protein
MRLNQISEGHEGSRREHMPLCSTAGTIHLDGSQVCDNSSGQFVYTPVTRSSFRDDQFRVAGPGPSRACAA